jgi:hypothetical protein
MTEGALQIDDARSSTSLAVPGLARRGYIETEHVVRGTASLYGYSDDGDGTDDATGSHRTILVESDLPFTTRLLVRRPEVPTEAAGTVILEPLHPAGDMPSAWPRVGRTITRSGFTWVGVTQDLAGLAATKASDPERYAELDIPHVGLGYDIVAQVAAMLRGPDSPVEIDHLLMTGASYTGTFQRVFLGDGFHTRTRRPDGGPAIEGYLIQISSGGFGVGGYNPINPDAGRLPLDDPRRTIGGHGVPVIELLGEGEAETHQRVTRDDSDERPDPYRLYEIPGGCHMSSGERGHGPLAPTVEEPSDFPMWAIAGQTLLNLRRWVVDGTPPPRADRLVHLDDAEAGPHGERADAIPLRRDEHGNAIGGVRTPYVDVPIASYYPHSTLAGEAMPGGPGRGAGIDMGDLLGCMHRFTPERLRELYGTPAEYQRQFGEAMERVVASRWIDPVDATWLVDQAAAIDF